MRGYHSAVLVWCPVVARTEGETVHKGGRRGFVLGRVRSERRRRRGAGARSCGGVRRVSLREELTGVRGVGAVSSFLLRLPLLLWRIWAWLNGGVPRRRLPSLRCSLRGRTGGGVAATGLLA